jgi:hypothetical protein
MPKSHFVSGSAPAAIEHPRCPKCLSRMLFVRIATGSSGFDLHTFECATCDHVHKVIVATAPLKPKPFRRILREPRSPK